MLSQTEVIATQIAIVHKLHISLCELQVGPAVSVYSNEAREGGLGVSLLERLLDLYKKKYDNKQLNYHRRSLLTNYRCHPSILMLASSLFYDCTLLSRSKSQPHPCAPYPIVFQCSSFQQDQLRVSDAYNEHEAKLLMSKLVEFIDSWPQIASRDKKPVHWSKVHIAVLAGTAQQVIKIISTCVVVILQYCIQRVAQHGVI